MILTPFYNGKCASFGVIHKKKVRKNAEMQFVIAPMLKSLKMGLESSDFYQIDGLGELIRKISKILGSFLPRVQKIAKMQFMKGLVREFVIFPMLNESFASKTFPL